VEGATGSPAARLGARRGRTAGTRESRPPIPAPVSSHAAHVLSPPSPAATLPSNPSCGKGPSRRHFGAAFIGTGVIAALYHATTGRVRRVFRKLDYYSIAYTSCVLRAATGARAPAPLAAAAALLTPLKPTLVTGANLAAIEARFLASALARPALRGAFGAHMGVALAGIACFALEDVLVLDLGLPPVFHSLWHTLSALALGLIGPLLAHMEAPLLLEGVQLVVTSA
jgi:hypothetical protein